MLLLRPVLRLRQRGHSGSLERRADFVEDRQGPIAFDTTCPFCGQHHDANTALSPPDFRSEGGAIALCTACGKFGVFDSGKRGGLSKPTWQERRIISNDPDAQEVRAAWEIVKRQL